MSKLSLNPSRVLTERWLHMASDTYDEMLIQGSCNACTAYFFYFVKALAYSAKIPE